MLNSNVHNCIASRLFQSIVGITFLLYFTSAISAQTADSTINILKNDSLKNSNIPALKTNTNKYHSPKKAAILSTIIPGAGQVYNKKYWKLPIIYGGAAALVYSFQFNQTRYLKYRNAYKYRIDGYGSTIDDYEGIYTPEDLNTLQKYYHRYRDLTVIGFAALYVLNIIDASVDAHLFTFDVSDNLSFNIQPTLINLAGINNCTGGINFSMSFRAEPRNLIRLRLE